MSISGLVNRLLNLGLNYILSSYGFATMNLTSSKKQYLHKTVKFHERFDKFGKLHTVTYFTAILKAINYDAMLAIRKKAKKSKRY